ncbi:hypothetical protein Tsubulata_025727 [Turnera subulata]|uniref:Acyl-ACP thioesterase-like C-terminal domain-containing protein n=1 Tax=Turnera subulata TaxID=218843 RepID=A0A9Q0FRA3_9ROSI|nr:hypothetical protein Tsubulata_025727 [Turnera subulata]
MFAGGAPFKPQRRRPRWLYAATVLSLSSTIAPPRSVTAATTEAEPSMETAAADGGVGDANEDCETNVYVMMNKKTRKLAKLVQSVRDEIGLSLTDDVSIFRSDIKSRYQVDINTADYVCTGLKPGWTEIDLNLHVNHVKYIDWIFEEGILICILNSIPHSFMACHELSAITLGYRKECHMNSVLQSMSKMVKNSSGNNGSGDDDVVEFEHLLCLEDGSRILKARTTWKPKEIHLNYNNYLGTQRGISVA